MPERLETFIRFHLELKPLPSWATLDGEDPIRSIHRAELATLRGDYAVA